MEGNRWSQRRLEKVPDHLRGRCPQEVGRGWRSFRDNQTPADYEIDNLGRSGGGRLKVENGEGSRKAAPKGISESVVSRSDVPVVQVRRISPGRRYMHRRTFVKVLLEADAPEIDTPERRDQIEGNGPRSSHGSAYELSTSLAPKSPTLGCRRPEA